MNKLVMVVIFLSLNVFADDGVPISGASVPKELTKTEIIKNLPNDGWSNTFIAKNITIKDIRSFHQVAFDGFVGGSILDRVFSGELEVELAVNGNVGASRRSMVAVQERIHANASLFSVIRFVETFTGDSGYDTFKYDILNVRVPYILKRGETKLIKFEGFSSKMIKVSVNAKDIVNFEMINE